MAGTRLPQGADKARAVRAMFDTIAPRYDLINTLMTLGFDRRWRRAAVAALGLPRGTPVLDVACGTGELCEELLEAGYEAVGMDLSQGMLDHSRTASPLLNADALAMPIRSASLKGVVSGFALRNVVSLQGLFDELARVLEPGGRAALLDVATPTHRLLRAGHALYFRHVIPWIGAALSDRAAYRYLPESVAYLPDPDEMLAGLKSAGFEARRRLLTGGVVQLLTATRVAS